MWVLAIGMLDRFSDSRSRRQRQKGPSRASALVMVDEGVVHDDLRALAVEGNDQNVGLRLLDNVSQFRLVLHLAHNLNIGLVGNRSHHQFPHQARMIRH